jgi:hypothetical protein
MKTQQAYIEGFTKKALAEGFTDHEAQALLKMSYRKDDDEGKSPNILKNTIIGAGGLGLAAGSTKFFPGKDKLQNKNLITITSGHLKPPVFRSDTGAGHTSPAESMYEALIRQPEILSKKLRAQLVLNKQLPDDQVVQIHKSPTGDKMHKNLGGITIDSGFGIYDRHAPSNDFKVNNENFIHAAVDPYSKKHSYSYIAEPPESKNTPIKPKGKLDRYLGKLYDMFVEQKHGNRIFYGQNPGDIKGGFNARDFSPFVSDEVIDRAMYEKAPNRADTIKKLINLAEQSGDAKTVSVLQDALAKNKKIITVSGSSRGDYVALRTRQLAKELRRQGLSDTHAVIALMGSAKQEALQKFIENQNVASFAKMDRGLFTAAQNIADAHWGSTGAASLAEMRLSPTALSGFLRNSNEVRDKELRLLKRYARRKGINIDALLNERGEVNLDRWNAANKYLLSEVHPDHGVMPIQDAKELLARLKAITPEDAVLAENRSRINAVKARNAKENLARWIIKRTQGMVDRHQAIRDMRTGLGVAGIGAGTALGVKALMNIIKNSKNKNREQHAEEINKQAAAEYGLTANKALELLKTAKEKPGLWANIRAKRARGEKPAKPGDKDYPDKKQWSKLTKDAAASPAWQRSEGKNPEGGLNAKGRASYKRETGGTLKAPVTESNPSGERAKRQNSFCSRMCGMKRVNTGAKAKSNPDSRINKSLRKWNCKCGEAHTIMLEKMSCLFHK